MASVSSSSPYPSPHAAPIVLPSINELFPVDLSQPPHATARTGTFLPPQLHQYSILVSRPDLTLHQLGRAPAHSLSTLVLEPSSGSPPSSSGSSNGDADDVGGSGSRQPKKHICPTCHKRFSRPSSLRIHANTHTGATPFHCPHPGCGRAFNVNSNMRRHARNHVGMMGGEGGGREPRPALGDRLGQSLPCELPASQWNKTGMNSEEADEGRIVLAEDVSRKLSIRRRPLLVDDARHVKEEESPFSAPIFSASPTSDWTASPSSEWSAYTVSDHSPAYSASSPRYSSPSSSPAYSSSSPDSESSHPGTPRAYSYNPAYPPTFPHTSQWASMSVPAVSYGESDVRSGGGQW